MLNICNSKKILTNLFIPNAANFNRTWNRLSKNGKMEFKEVVFGSQLCASWLLELGDRVAFAGPSKSGKSLQLEILVGEVPIESGEQGEKNPGCL